MRTIIGLYLAAAASVVAANNVQLVGAMQGKATLIVNGGNPKTLKVGEKTDTGIKLISADADGAELAWEGKRKRFKIGSTGMLGSPFAVALATPAARAKPAASAGTEQAITLQADRGGHFWATVSINGLSVRGMIDTGATGVAMSSLQARSLGIEYRNGQKSMASTAAGYVPMYRVTLNEVRLGDIVMYQIPASVIEGAFPEAPLLGNTLLSRFNMDRRGDLLTLTKRF